MTNFNPKAKKPKVDKTVISLRIGYDVLDKLEKHCTRLNMSRNELIMQCIDYALDSIKK